ncbi:hypothetical protein AC1031_014365 [Aphanomyces cochlioides]|nr:hypothetical protein AC1031_014365 [Aphanomyces cochlioides]
MVKSGLLTPALHGWCVSTVDGSHRLAALGVKRSDVWKPNGGLFAHEVPSKDLPREESTVSDVDPTNSQLSMEDKKAIAIEFIQKQMEVTGIPGMVLSVVVQTVLSRGFGTTEFGNPKRVVKADTIFQIEGLSQTLVALAMATLVEKHEIDLRDTVNTYLRGLLSETNTPRTTRSGKETCLHLSTTCFWAKHRGRHKQNVVSVCERGRPGSPRHDQHVWTTSGRDKDQLTSGHFVCNGRTMRPFSVLNSTMVASPPSNQYAASYSMVGSIDDMTKLSRSLLQHGHGLFHNRETFADMLSGHNIKSIDRDAFSMKAFGFTNITRETLVTSGIGFEIIGNVVEDQLYFGNNVGGDAVGGWLPKQQIGVVLLDNGFTSHGRTCDTFRILAMRTYLLRLFMGVPVARLDPDFHDWAAWIDGQFPALECDSHYFDGTPWETPGLDIPDSTKTALVGTYRAANSPGFNGNVTVTRDGHDLTLQYGIITRRLIATKQPNEFIWALEKRAVTFTVGVSGLNTKSPVIHLAYMVDFQRCGALSSA